MVVLEPEWWFSRKRVLLCFYGAVLFFFVGWIGSYCIWLGDGCTPFLPFVSDFAGGPIQPFFIITFTLGTVLLMPTWVDYYVVTRDEFGSLGKKLYVFLPGMGLFSMVSLLGVVWCSWFWRIRPHCVFAISTFLGGFILTLLFPASEVAKGKSKLSCDVIGSAAQFLVGCMCALLGLKCIVRGILAFTKERRDFMGNLDDTIGGTYFTYCSGERGTPHGIANLNYAAMFEWLMILVIWLPLAAKIHVVLASWPDRKEAEALMPAQQSDNINSNTFI